jgi:hypothetical protein
MSGGYMRFAPKPTMKEHLLGGAGGIMLLDLKEPNCRWPLDDGTYCGAKHAEHSSYCPCHEYRAHHEL